MFNLINGFLLGFKNYSEGNANNERKGSKGKPAGLPVAYQPATFPLTIGIHDFACSQCSDGGTQAVSYHHEQSLGRSLDVRFALLVNKDTT